MHDEMLYLPFACEMHGFTTNVKVDGCLLDVASGSLVDTD
jgi:hypothetical protein